MAEFTTEVTDIIKRTPDVKSFRLKFVDGMHFDPGQYFFLTIKVDGREAAKPFSFSSSPTEKGYVEFTKRITDSPYSKSLDSMKTGNAVHVRMAYGSLTFSGEYKKIAFLSGGIGITPIRSICKYAGDTRLASSLVLLYSNRRKEDIIFREDFDAMQKDNKNLKVVYALTSLELDPEWRGSQGYISTSMIKEEIPDYNERIFYVCGPPNMVKNLIETLEGGLGVGKDKIKLEQFAGY